MDYSPNPENIEMVCAFYLAYTDIKIDYLIISPKSADQAKRFQIRQKNNLNTFKNFIPRNMQISSKYLMVFGQEYLKKNKTSLIMYRHENEVSSLGEVVLRSSNYIIFGMHSTYVTQDLLGLFCTGRKAECIPMATVVDKWIPSVTSEYRIESEMAILGYSGKLLFYEITPFKMDMKLVNKDIFVENAYFELDQGMEWLSRTQNRINNWFETLQTRKYASDGDKNLTTDQKKAEKEGKIFIKNIFFSIFSKILNDLNFF